ncbi:MAG: glycoside hydrolase family 3 C-terminal domain-containing protein [Spirochaetaceae bacterium]|jgi:beta-glucosidase|nr:glycoside hydrolase family 3 C-terminal domain-containing protein [Spirochaetaceae bacterium]
MSEIKAKDFDIKAKARELVSKMTLEEKVSQMLHSAKALEKHNIPAYNWWNEALHGVARAGVATAFPQAIALASTFDEDLVRRIAEVISTEGRAKYNMQQEEDDRDIYKGITFWSPNINIFRDPRWGRGQETYGEDPYLTSRLGVAFIKGLQGDDRDSLKSAACAKHFAVHSGPENDRHRFNAIVDEYDLWNTYLAAFEAAVKEGGVEVVMGAYNRTLGEPCCGSKFLLKDILRDKWGFDGHVVSDCWAIKDFHENHLITSSPLESVALAIRSGCDINCGIMFSLAAEAVENGLLSEAEIDKAVTRLFVTRMRLGILGGAPENKLYTGIPYEKVDCPEHRALNLEAARRSIILLKNEGVLPLNENNIKTIGVIGPNADNRRSLDGNYQGTPSRRVTVLEGIREIAEASGIRVMFSEGCDMLKDRRESLAQKDDRLSEARAVAKRSDAVLVVLGLDGSVEGEENDAYSESDAGDKPNIELPGRQEKMLRDVVKAAGKKPVIVVTISGSAIVSEWADENVGALIQSFYPGALGGQAVAEVIFGRFSPSGKLPVTFYRNTNDLPDFTDYNMDNRTYRYFKGEPLYPFGFGLSYASFELSGVKADKNKVTVKIKNTSSEDARETLQVYVSSPETKEIRSLCGIKPVNLHSGEERDIVIPLNKNTFSRYDEDGNMREIHGIHKLSVGFTQPDARSAALYGVKPVELTVTV